MILKKIPRMLRSQDARYSDLRTYFRERLGMIGRAANEMPRGLERLFLEEMEERKPLAEIGVVCDVSSGGRIRTSDLRVMSPTSCHCSTPQSIRGV